MENVRLSSTRLCVLRALSVLGTLCVLCVNLAAQVAIGGGYERDRFTYHFDNDSSFDTPTLVPHFFEQTYVADNFWLAGSARYRAGILWETTGGVTPTKTGIGDDYDTFFNPNGDVIVSGTTGGIAIWSWRAGQRALISTGGPFSLFSGYRLRVDNADWQLGHSRTTRNGRLVEAHDTTDREFTTSQMHEVSTGVRIEPQATGHWRTRVDLEGSPAVIGRLSIELPDKYPGRTLLFVSKGASAAAALAVSYRSRIPITAGVRAFHTWSYSSSRQLQRNTITLLVTVG